MVRTLGPRSVSSFLKILLDITLVALAVVLVGMGLFALLSAIALVNPAPFSQWRYPDGYPILPNTPARAANLLNMCLGPLALMFIVGRLRKIFITLIAGDPFTAENARRLRVIGLVLAALEGSRYLIYAILIWGLRDVPRFARPEINFTALFAVGVMFVLAEVFDEGVRMKKDLELTI